MVEMKLTKKEQKTMKNVCKPFNSIFLEPLKLFSCFEVRFKKKVYIIIRIK